MKRNYHQENLGSNMDFQDAQDYLNSLVSYENLNKIYYNPQDLNLQKVKDALRDLQIDFQKLKYIHVAGSKGKGTTSRIIANYLRNSEFNVGIYISPHLVDVCERIVVNGRKISKKKFSKGVFEIKNYIEQSRNLLTYFEILTVLALEFFVGKNLDYVVLEVGIGGRLDATNIVKPVVSVLTSVEKEHLELLGGSLSKIVDEKLGIKKVGIPLIIGEQTKVVLRLINSKTGNNKEYIFLPKVGDFIFEDKAFSANARLSYLVLKFLLGNVQFDRFESVLKKFRIAGHFDIKKLGNKIVVFDVAHTLLSMKNFVALLKIRFPGKKLIFLVALMKDKDIKGILEVIAKVAERALFANAHSLRGELPKNLAKTIKTFAFKKVSCIDDVKVAYKKSVSSLNKDEVLVVTGSHFLIGSIYKNFNL